MATNLAGLTNFIIWAPDCADAGAHERRLSVRSQHLDNARQLMKNGALRVGGGVLTSDSTNAATDDRRFFGSCLIVEAESLEAARRLAESDIYYTTGVWDKGKLQILPMLMAHPLPALLSE